MANTKSAVKRIRQNERDRKHNSSVRSSLRTAAKKVIKTVTSSTNPEEIKENFKQFVKSIDTAARKGIIHKRTAARKKSRLAMRVNASANKSI